MSRIEIINRPFQGSASIEKGEFFLWNFIGFKISGVVLCQYLQAVPDFFVIWFVRFCDHVLNSKKNKGQGDFLEGELETERSVVKAGGGRARAWDAFRIPQFPSLFALFPPLHPTPPLYVRLLPHPILLTPLLPQHNQPQTLVFCMKGANPMNNPVCLSQNKPVGEGSTSKPGRLEQRGAQPLVISPRIGSATCSDPLPFAHWAVHCSPADWLSAWLTESHLPVAHSLSLSVPTPSLLPSYFPPRSARDWEGAPQTFVWTARRRHREDFFARLLFSPSSPSHLSSLIKSTWMDFFVFCRRQTSQSETGSLFHLQVKF